MSMAPQKIIAMFVIICLNQLVSSDNITDDLSTNCTNTNDATKLSTTEVFETSTDTALNNPVCLDASCEGRCGSTINPYRNQPCGCDSLCTIYNDCCQNYHALCVNTTDVFRLKPDIGNCNGSQTTCFSCPKHSVFKFATLYVVSICPDHFLGNRMIAEKCQNKKSDDVIIHLPIYANSKGHIYRNVYCALCHSVPLGKMKTFSTNFNCPVNATDSKEYFERRRLSEITFSEVTEKHCKVEIKLPDEEYELGRECVASEYHNCEGSRDLKTKCDAFQNPIRIWPNGLDAVGGHTFTARNWYCAKCSPYADKELVCWKKRITSGGIFIERLRFSVLFDFSTDVDPADDPNLDRTESYGTLLSPGNSRFKAGNSRFKEETYLLSFTIKMLNNDSILNVKQNLEESLTPVMIDYEECSEQHHVYLFNTTFSLNKTFSPDLVEIFSELVFRNQDEFQVLTAIMRNTIKPLSDICVAPFRIYNSTTFDELLNKRNDKAGSVNQTNGLDFPVEITLGKPDNQTYFCESIEKKKMAVNNEAIENPSKLDLYYIVCGELLETECDLTLYDIDDLFNKSGTLDSSQLNTSVLYQTDSVLAVCEKVYITDTSSPILQSTSPVEFYVTVIGCSMSIIGLIITITTYCIFVELRNVAGKSILSLTGAMLMAQCLFIVGGTVAWRDSTACIILAVTQHFLWLATFSWSNILSFDLAKTFSSKTSVPRTRGNKKYLFYSVIAWGIPGVIVSTCIALNFTSTFSMGYGDKGMCWIRGPIALLVTFIAPVSAHILFNIFAFGYTVHHIRKIRKLSQEMNVTSARRSQLGVYARITAVMGFTWAFGYVSNLWPIEALLIIFSALNSLQGFFICIAFVLTAKVIGLYRKRFFHPNITRRSSISVTAPSTSTSNLLTVSSTSL